MKQVWYGVCTMVLMLVCTGVLNAEQVALRFDVPPGLSGYSGRQPVTFGVPFPQGALKRRDALRITDSVGRDVPSQFEVTATWTRDGDDVRWLLIDTFAEVREGKAEPLTLHFGSAVPASMVMNPLRLKQEQNAVQVQTGSRAFTLGADGSGIGTFTLRDGGGKLYRADPAASIEIERRGPVRAVVKLQGRYVDEQGQSIAEHITRVRFYANSPFVRVYHTMVWLTDDNTRIGELAFIPSDMSGSSVSAGLDGQSVTATGGKLDLRQTDWNVVQGSREGKQLDGWLHAQRDRGTLTAAVRWPWQQFPLGLGATQDGSPIVRLLGPVEPMSLKPMDVAVEGVKLNVPSWNLRIFKGGAPGGDVIYNGPPALPNLTPRGVSKTWELLLWYGDDKAAAPSPQVINTLAQHPVLGFADPAFAVKAELPSPASPYDPQSFPQVERALRNAFAFYTRELAEEGDFGVWNYGDLQWIWTSRGYPIYRYWMNLGKGWSVVPWALWLRSGQRQYWDNGEANSRHAMDVDMCHVPGWERDPNDFRLRGGQYHYSAIHWGYGPEVFTYYVDSEFLPYCWYMTGYERARDVMLEHAEAMARWEQRDTWLNHFREDIRARAGRHLYVMLKNTLVLYEATWDDRLKALADEVLELMRQAQYEDGNFPHVKTNHYLDEPLNIAVRVYGWQRVGDMLSRWHAALGDPLQASPKGGMAGPMALWSAVNVHRHGGEARVLDVAARLMRTQAATVDDSDTVWRGLNGIPGHEAGPALRQWPTVMAALKANPDVVSEGYLPFPGFHSRLAVSKEMEAEGWSLRHVALTMSTSSEPTRVELRWIQTPQFARVRVLGADGQVVAEHEQETQAAVASHDARMITLQAPASATPIAYVIVVDVKQPKLKGFGPSLSIGSSSGKVVHYMPEGWRNFNGPQHAGEFWVKPIVGQELRVSWAQGDDVLGRHVLLDAQGRELAATRISGSRPFKHPNNPASYAPMLPAAESLIYRATGDVGLCRVILTSEGKWNRWYELRGMLPYVAATAEAWFDPTELPHAPLPSAD